MKRTKQAYFRQNPTLGETKDLSGVTFTYGEDNNYHQRVRNYQQEQKQHLDQQVLQKQQIKQQNDQTNQNIDKNLIQVNRYRGQLESQKHQHLTNMERACDDFNLLQAQERKLREKIQRQQQLGQQRRELQLLNQRNVKRFIPRKQ